MNNLRIRLEGSDEELRFNEGDRVMVKINVPSDGMTRAGSLEIKRVEGYLKNLSGMEKYSYQSDGRVVHAIMRYGQLEGLAEQDFVRSIDILKD